MTLLVQAYFSLLWMDLLLKHDDFSALYDCVRCAPSVQRPEAPELVSRVCRAIDLASIWYWKQVPCLQRSAATTCMLRRRGVSAQMVIGAQPVPFRAHAWVEVDGKVVNDKAYIADLYAVLDRC